MCRWRTCFSLYKECTFMQHIMVAHDLSAEAAIALQRACSWRKQHQTRLSVLYV